MSKTKLGISSCLIGENVRWNGGHCLSKYLSGINNEYEYVSVCPEVGIGLGVPRPTVRLVKDIEDIEDIGKVRLMSSKTGEDYTDVMNDYSKQKVEELRLKCINGFILKSKSPTCGLRVKVYNSYLEKGSSQKDVGIFAKLLSRYWPELPITEEGRLNDNALNEKFFISVDCHKDWNDNVSSTDINTLIDFHQRHKYLLEVLNYEKKKELGNIVANQKDFEDVFGVYYSTFFLTLRDSKFTIDKICNVYSKLFNKILKEYDSVSKEDKKEFYEYLNLVKLGKVDKFIPKVLLKHYVRKTHNKYLDKQKILK